MGIREEFIINLFFFALAICQPLALVGLDSLNTLDSFYLLLILLLRLTLLPGFPKRHYSQIWLALPSS